MQIVRHRYFQKEEDMNNCLSMPQSLAYLFIQAVNQLTTLFSRHMKVAFSRID